MQYVYHGVDFAVPGAGEGPRQAGVLGRQVNRGAFNRLRPALRQVTGRTAAACGLGIGLILLAAAACFGSISIEEYPTELRCPECPATGVSRVVDGDTLHTRMGRVRLFGVDAPERGERCYSQAASALRQLAGRTVRLEPGPRARDPGGRLLFYVYTEEGNSIDEILVDQGLARAWDRDGQHRDRLIALERDARWNGVGCLW